ncbi:MAG: response regulator [Nitrospina sp.]|jgi:two-component system chemotaxis response regulator CheY|nr:response regulator [Nitrospina sp.]MBT3508777.1 response regulator [Nitrospina sp.]MBT3874591.1 response regulator [Nitrospina sp.]MBT4047065.1 response regulator [Nitrospina sp.]MBT4557913.1 response regulator [Nitrospina sp.]
MNPYTKILVVEDESTSSKLMTYHLKMMGFKNVIEVTGGDTAIKQLKKEKADLVIADWHMPNMNGLNLFRTLREEEAWQDIPFLMVTVEKDHQKVQEAIQAGVREYIVKPIKVDVFKRKVLELLGLNEV